MLVSVSRSDHDLHTSISSCRNPSFQFHTGPGFGRVCSISGATFHRGALAIVGTLLNGHGLIGRPGPLRTPNPLAHGVFDRGEGVEMSSDASGDLIAGGMVP